MLSRADGRALLVALVAHGTLALALVEARLPSAKRPSVVEVELRSPKATERAASAPPAAAAPPHRATQPVHRVEIAKLVQPTEEHAPVPVEDEPVPDETQPPAAAASATAPTDGGVGGGTGGHAQGVAGGVVGGVGKAGGDALVGPSFGAAYLRNTPPAYPALAKRMNLQGTTTLRVLVGADGRPHSVKIHDSSGVDALDQAALEAVQHWSFVPARRGNTPVEAEVNVPVRFQLDGATR